MDRRSAPKSLAILALVSVGLFLAAGVASPPPQAAVGPCSTRKLTDCLLYINPQGKPIPNSFAGEFMVEGELMAGELMVDGEIMAGELMVDGEITAGELMVRGEITTMDLMVQDTLMVGSGTVTIMEDSIDWGPGANDDLTAADVTDLTDGGETNLHTHPEGAHNHDAAYLNDDQADTMTAAVDGALLTVNNTVNESYPEDYQIDAVGIYASGDDAGVYAVADSGAGVYAVGTCCGVEAVGNYTGVRGTSDCEGCAGVTGRSENGTGVSGISDYGDGVVGAAFDDGYGVEGFSENGTGVYGTGKANGVYGSSSQGTGVRAFSSSGLPLRVAGSSGANLIEAYENSGIYYYPYGGPNLRFKVTRSGNVTADGTFTGGGADFAEMVTADSGTYEPGDVLVISPLNPGQVTLSSAQYQTSLIGVYSTKPGFLGGYDDEQDQSGMIPVAITGIVPVKVTAENGAISPGDLLTTSTTPGHAMKASPVTINGISFYLPGTILGKALEPLEEGAGIILILVTLQ